MNTIPITDASSHMVTACGNEVDLRYPRVETITLADISHHLAQINRYTGACRRPFSVAEHSLLVLEVLQRVFTLDVHGLMAGLMHDAHEAYTQDLSTPAKGQVGEAWHAFEGRMQRAVLSAFGLHAATQKHQPAIKQADLIALATERQQLLPTGPGISLWPCLVHVTPVGWVDLMSPERCAMAWTDWRDRFKDETDSLDFGRNSALFKKPGVTSWAAAPAPGAPAGAGRRGRPAAAHGAGAARVLPR